MNYSIGYWELNSEFEYSKDNKSLIFDREISAFEKISIDQSINDIEEIVTFNSYYLMEYESIKELIDRITILTDKKYKLQPPYFDIEKVYVFQKLLSSTILYFVLYINYHEATFRGTSKDKFISIAKRYYDEYFEYRFLYKLRNYITHISLPKIIFNDTIDSRKRNILLDTNSLLQNYNGWSSVKKDLAQRISGIDMLELFLNMKAMFFQFHKEVILINQAKYAIAMNILSMYVKEIHGKLILPVIIFPYTEDELRNGKFSFNHDFRTFGQVNQIMRDLHISEFIP